MHPFLWTEPYIGSYRVMLLLGFVAAFLLARWRARKAGFDPRHVDNVILILMVVGPAGARLCSRLFYHHTPMSFWEALKLWEGGGLVFYGGAIAGFLTVIIYSLVRSVSILRFMDILAPSLALGLAFGRVGCFLSGCCWGDICADPQVLSGLSPVKQQQVQTVPALSPAGFPLAVQFPNTAGAYQQHRKLGLVTDENTRSLPVHPTQVYETVMAFGLCVWLNRRFKDKKRDGDIVWLCAAGYAVLRFAVEFIRAESPQSYWGGLTFSQVVSIWILFAAVAGYTISRWLQRRATVPAPKPAM